MAERLVTNGSADLFLACVLGRTLHIPSAMRIAVIRRRFTPVGGAELYVQRLIENLIRQGQEVHLIAEFWEQVPEGASFHQIEHTGSRAERPLRFAELVQKHVRENNYDCVFATERSYEQDVYRAGDGVFKVWLEQRKKFAPWWKKLFVASSRFHRNMMAVEEKTFDPNNTRRIIVNSLVVKNEILSNYNYPEERIHLIRNGVDLNRFKPGNKGEARALFGLREDDYVMLFVGSGWERKNLRFLTNVVLPEVNLQIGPAKLLVVGKGNPLGYKKENVVFAGGQKKVELAYQAADVLLFLPIYEPGANVCYEALACGVPVISNEQNGGSEIVTNGVNGRTVSAPDNLEETLAAIREWMPRRNQLIQVDRPALAIERNVSETIELLRLASSERRG